MGNGAGTLKCCDGRPISTRSNLTQTGMNDQPAFVFQMPSQRQRDSQRIHFTSEDISERNNQNPNLRQLGLNSQGSVPSSEGNVVITDEDIKQISASVREKENQEETLEDRIIEALQIAQPLRKPYEKQIKQFLQQIESDYKKQIKEAKQTEGQQLQPNNYMFIDNQCEELCDTDSEQDFQGFSFRKSRKNKEASDTQRLGQLRSQTKQITSYQKDKSISQKNQTSMFTQLSPITQTSKVQQTKKAPKGPYSHIQPKYMQHYYNSTKNKRDSGGTVNFTSHHTKENLIPVQSSPIKGKNTKLRSASSLDRNRPTEKLFTVSSGPEDFTQSVDHQNHQRHSTISSSKEQVSYQVSPSLNYRASIKISNRNSQASFQKLNRAASSIDSDQESVSGMRHWLFQFQQPIEMFSTQQTNSTSKQQLMKKDEERGLHSQAQLFRSFQGVVKEQDRHSNFNLNKKQLKHCQQRKYLVSNCPNQKSTQSNKPHHFVVSPAKTNRRRLAATSKSPGKTTNPDYQKQIMEYIPQEEPMQMLQQPQLYQKEFPLFQQILEEERESDKQLSVFEQQTPILEQADQSCLEIDIDLQNFISSQGKTNRVKRGQQDQHCSCCRQNVLSLGDSLNVDYQESGEATVPSTLPLSAKNFNNRTPKSVDGSSLQQQQQQMQLQAALKCSSENKRYMAYDYNNKGQSEIKAQIANRYPQSPQTNTQDWQDTPLSQTGLHLQDHHQALTPQSKCHLTQVNGAPRHNRNLTIEEEFKKMQRTTLSPNYKQRRNMVLQHNAQLFVDPSFKQGPEGQCKIGKDNTQVTDSMMSCAADNSDFVKFQELPPSGFPGEGFKDIQFITGSYDKRNDSSIKSVTPSSGYEQSFIINHESKDPKLQRLRRNYRSDK